MKRTNKKTRKKQPVNQDERPKIETEVLEKSKFKKAWASVQRVSSKVLTFYLLAVSATGYTIFKLFPDCELSLLSPSDQSALAVQIKNNSWVPMKNVKQYLFINNLTPIRGEPINKLQFNSVNADVDKIGRGESYGYTHDLSLFYNYTHQFYVFKAEIAIEVNYDFALFECTDVFFVSALNYRGNGLWTSATEQPFYLEMKNSKVKPKFEDIPGLKNIIENQEQKRRQ